MGFRLSRIAKTSNKSQKIDTEEGSMDNNPEINHENQAETKEKLLKTHKPRQRKIQYTKEQPQKTSISLIILLILAIGIIAFNQIQMIGIANALPSGSSSTPRNAKLQNVDVTGITSTTQTIGRVFPVAEWKTQDDVIADMLPTGTPDYGAGLGVSFDTPEESLATLAQMYPSLKKEVQQNNPTAWARYMKLASMPGGMSCEFCCGIGAVGIDKQGNSACGCQHNPAILSVGLWLTANTDYTDAEIMREVMRWKTLFFPQKMIAIGTSLAGADANTISQLPGQVGGC